MIPPSLKAFASLALLSYLQYTTVKADYLPPSAYCFDSISEAYATISYADATGLGGWDPCSSATKVTSIYGAASLYCSTDEFVSGAEYFMDQCLTEYFVTIDPPSVFQMSDWSLNVSDWPVLTQSDYVVGTNVTEVSLIEMAWFNVSYRTVTTWEYEVGKHAEYGWAIYGFWAIIVLAGVLNNIYSSFFAAKLSPDSRVDLEGTETKHKPSNSVTSWLETNLVLAPLFGTYRRRLYLWCSVPTRLEAFVIYSYWTISLVLCCVNYQTFDGNLYWPGTREQGWRYVADRTGIAAFANLPILWMFAGRNNVFLWATGWSFSTFNLFHKHVARVATIEALVHGISYTVQAKWDGYFDSYWADLWWVWGVVALVLMCFLVASASVILRSKAYEVFLLLHIAMSAVLIYGLFQHTIIFDGQYYPYLWPLVAIWSFDRFLRIVRLAVCNIGFTRSGGISFTNSQVTYDADADILTITLTPPSGSLMQRLQSQPGQYVYLYRPLSWKGWENHPFTVGWNTGTTEEIASSCNSQLSSSENIGDKKAQVTVRSIDASSTPSIDRKLTIWIRPFSGWTRRLARQCLASQNAANDSWSTLWTSAIWMEGPYYNHHGNLLQVNDRLLLIAGGTGIAAITPWIKQYTEATARRSKSTSRSIDDRIRTRSLHIIWANKGHEFIQGVCRNELASALAREHVSIQAHDTSSQASSTRDKAIDSDIGILAGRPDLTEAIMHHATLCKDRVTVVLCGPAAMADEVRAAVLKARRSGALADVHYAEEVFGW